MDLQARSKAAPLQAVGTITSYLRDRPLRPLRSAESGCLFGIARPQFRRPSLDRRSLLNLRSRRRFHEFPKTRANGCQAAMGAIWFLGITTAAAVPNQPMTEKRPIALWNERHQIELNFIRVLLTGETETLSQTPDVRIDYNAGVNIERIAQNYIRSFPTHSG
jgi:hypothetical protein